MSCRLRTAKSACSRLDHRAPRLPRGRARTLRGICEAAGGPWTCRLASRRAARSSVLPSRSSANSSPVRAVRKSRTCPSSRHAHLVWVPGRQSRWRPVPRLGMKGERTGDLRLLAAHHIRGSRAGCVQESPGAMATGASSASKRSGSRAERAQVRRAGQIGGSHASRCASPPCRRGGAAAVRELSRQPAISGRRASPAGSRRAPMPGPWRVSSTRSPRQSESRSRDVPQSPAM